MKVRLLNGNEKKLKLEYSLQTISYIDREARATKEIHQILGGNDEK